MHPETFRRALAATARVACCSAFLGCTPKPASPAVASPVVEKDSLSACRAHTQAVFTDKTQTVSARTKSCCQQLAATLESTPERVSDWRELDSCCEMLEFRDFRACTPWGPPCPPALETV